MILLKYVKLIEALHDIEELATCKASIKFSQASYLRLHSEMILLKYVYTFWYHDCTMACLRCMSHHNMELRPQQIVFCQASHLKLHSEMILLKVNLLLGRIYILQKYH